MTITATCPTGVASPNPRSGAISDVKSSELVEAVVALNMETSLTPKRPLAAPIQVEGPKEVDSGYASKSSTPENSKFGPFVVAKTPLLSLTRRKKTKLMHFEKEIPKLTQNRSEDLRELYADSLNNLVSGISKSRGILMTLKVLGESEETAEPWVFIQCDKAIAKKVRRFFKQSSVVSDFKPPSPDIYTPKLDVYVHELPPLLLGRNSPLSPTSTDSINLSPNLFESVELFYEQDPRAQYSLCGSKAIVSVNGQWRSATIGGLISVETAEGYIQDFGLTAGHFLNGDCYTESFDEEVQETDEEETDDDADDEFFDDGQDFELDLGSMEELAPTTSVHKTSTQLGAPSNPKSSIGHVFWTSHKNLQDQPNLDWALFTIGNNTLKLPNIVLADEITQTNTDDVEETRAVILSTASRGRTYGMLSSSWSYLALAPGNGLVRTKAVKFARNQVLEPGDSGAWVVDSISNQLYGHVVASDVFGVSYIVPASDVFRDIQLRLSLKAVKLPPSILPIFEAQVPSTNDLSQGQVSKTLSNTLTTVAFHQSILEESGSGHQLSGGGDPLAEAEGQAIVRRRKLSGHASHNHSLESLKVKMEVSAFDESQQQKADNKPETRHILPPIENSNSVSWSPFSVPEAAHIYPRQTFIEPDDSMQRQKIPRKPVVVNEASAFGPNKINAVPEPSAPFKRNASSSTKFGVVTDPAPLNRPIATTFEVPRIPVVAHEHVAPSAARPGAPKSKDNILVRVFQKLKILKRSSKAVHLPDAGVTIISSEDMASMYSQGVRQPNFLPPNVPKGGFSDSGYSTMANTPASSKHPSPAGSPSYPRI